MLEMKVGTVSVCFYFGFFAAVAFTFFLGQADTFGVAAAIVSCILHETGHLSAMCLMSSKPKKICFYAGGIKIIPRHDVIDSRRVQTVILFAGCAVNFLLSLISYLLGYEMLTEINLALAIFNLLPFSYFDGGRIIGLYAPETLRKTLAAVCTAMLAAAFIKVGKISPAAALVLLFAAISEIFM